MILLKPDFVLSDFCHSDRADALKIDNTTQDPTIINNLIALHKMLVHLQAQLTIKFARPVQLGLNCAYRSLALNKILAGSVSTSEHMKGKAADLSIFGVKIPEAFTAAQQFAKDNIVPVGQLINETQWIHVSTPEPHHNEFMVTTDHQHYTHV